MISGQKGRRARIATILGISVAVGALLVLALVPSVGSALRPQDQGVTAPAAATTCANVANPTIPGYDPVTHEIYVPNSGSSSITVYNETCNLVGTIDLPANSIPWQAAFDPSENYMYVTDYGLNVVYEISGTKIVHKVTGFDSPLGITYDPYWAEMLVVNSGKDEVDFIDANTLIVDFSTGSNPNQIVYDPLPGCDIVTNSGSNNVTIYNDQTAVWGSVAVGKSPDGIAYDPVSQVVYVTNTGSNTVSILLSTIGGSSVLATVSGFDQPDAVAWDQADLHIYVTNDGNGKVFELSGGTILKKVSTASDSVPDGLAYDEFNDDMYVSGSNTNLVYVLS